MRLMVMDCSDMDLDGILPLLSPGRRELATEFVFLRDRRLSAGAGLFMRFLEGEYGPIAYAEPNFKPHFADGGMDFNISHSGDFVICAVSERTVGADIEGIGSNQDLAEAVMRPSELEIFLGSDPEHREELFARLWTVKESYMKALGRGLSLPPETFQVLSGDGFSFDACPGGFSLWEPEAPEGYRISVCHLEKGPFRTEHLTPDRLAGMIRRTSTNQSIK